MVPLLNNTFVVPQSLSAPPYWLKFQRQTCYYPVCLVWDEFLPSTVTNCSCLMIDLCCYYCLY